MMRTRERSGRGNGDPEQGSSYPYSLLFTDFLSGSGSGRNSQTSVHHRSAVGAMLSSPRCLYYVTVGAAIMESSVHQTLQNEMVTL